MDRAELETLLPFLVNGTLEGDELSQVQAAVDADPDLAAQVAALTALRTTLQDEPYQSPGEFGHARLMRSIAQETSVQSASPQTGTRRPYLWQAVAAALLAVVLGQAVFMQQRGGEDYSLAGSEDAMTVQAAFTVAIAPNTTEAALRGLLLDAGVQIVSGPTALGLYQLGLLEGTTLQDARLVLEAADGIVEDISVTGD